MSRSSVDTPPVGWIVQWFMGGDRKQTPCAALVTGGRPGGMVELRMWQRGGGDALSLACVRHVDDEYLIDNPQRRIQEGAWDWVPNQVYQSPDTEEREVEQRVLDLSYAGKNPVQIAGIVKRRNWNVQRIETLLEERRQLAGV